MPIEILIPMHGGGFLSVLPLVGKPNGYCVHKVANGSKRGLITKIELFGYFQTRLLNVIRSNVGKLPASKGRYPAYFKKKGKYRTLLHVVVLWKKSPVQIRAYTQGGKVLKLEVTRGVLKGQGRKYLSPVATLNALGQLLKRITENQPTVLNKIHDDFYFIDTFLKNCEVEFRQNKLRGQLQNLKRQKLRNNIKFGFKRKQKKHF